MNKFCILFHPQPNKFPIIQPPDGHIHVNAPFTHPTHDLVKVLSRSKILWHPRLRQFTNAWTHEREWSLSTSSSFINWWDNSIIVQSKFHIVLFSFLQTASKSGSRIQAKQNEWFWFGNLIDVHLIVLDSIKSLGVHGKFLEIVLQSSFIQKANFIATTIPNSRQYSYLI